MPVPGLVAVAGGKYTTYRVMARDAIDAVARGLDRTVPPSATHVTPLVGADGFQALWNRPRAGGGGERAARRPHRAPAAAATGRGSTSLLAEIAERPELGKPLPGADDYLAVEVRYACSHEGALHLDDVLTRRTRISIETWDRGLEAAKHAARLMAEVLGWDDATVDERDRDLPRARRGRATLAGAARRPRRRPRAHRRAGRARLPANAL